MTHTSAAILKANLRQYKTPTTKDAYERGFERGYNCASWVNLPEIGDTVRTVDDGRVTVDESNQWDVVSSLAYESESNGRDFSPFEFTASEFNKARNSEARWEAFGTGISDGIQSNISDRMEANLADKTPLHPIGGCCYMGFCGEARRIAAHNESKVGR